MTEQHELQTTEKMEQDFEVVQTPDGKFQKVMKYRKYYSFIPETTQDQLRLYNALNDQTNKIVTPLKNMIGEKLTIKNVFMNPYESLDRNTGELTYGVTTSIENADGAFFATSSKSVYYSLINMFESFGYPNTDSYNHLEVEVTGTKMPNGVQINLNLVDIK